MGTGLTKFDKDIKLQEKQQFESSQSPYHSTLALGQSSTPS